MPQAVPLRITSQGARARGGQVRHVCARLAGLVAIAWMLWQIAPVAAAPALTKAPAAGQEAADERANRDLEDLRRRISETQRALAATEESRTEAADALRKSEQAISDATRSLHELNEQEHNALLAMNSLARAQSVSTEAIAQGQARLGALLRQQYRAGGDERLALWLSGGAPERLARDTEYLRRLAQARMTAVAGLRHDLQRLAELNREAHQQAEALARTRDAHARERVRLQQESSARARLVNDLSSRLQAQRRNLQTLQRDERRLTDLVERIARQLEERRQQRERAQRERAERAERQQKEKDRAARERAAGERKTPGGARSADTDAAAAAGAGDGAGEGRHGETVARIDEAAEEGYDTEAFPRMKGHLRLPVTGELANRFGSPREDSGLNWRGLFIRAPQGREVRAVAAGRVVFSDWLRGFGNLLIIDHGGGYMSLYGNTEALLARVGAVVKGGSPVASVGNSGGNAEPGLYFELRHQSRPFDPMAWVGR